MNLQEQGFRFILRRKDGRVDGYWEPKPINPGGVDCTDMTDDEMDRAILGAQLEVDELDIGPDARRAVEPYLRPAIK